MAEGEAALERNDAKGVRASASRLEELFESGVSDSELLLASHRLRKTLEDAYEKLESEQLILRPCFKCGSELFLVSKATQLQFEGIRATFSWEVDGEEKELAWRPRMRLVICQSCRRMDMHVIHDEALLSEAFQSRRATTATPYR